MEYLEVEEFFSNLDGQIMIIQDVCHGCLNVAEDLKNEKDAKAALITLKHILSCEIEMFLESQDKVPVN